MLHEVNFEVIASLDDFFYSEKFISLAVGPVGSTKTTARYYENRASCGTDGPV